MQLLQRFILSKHIGLLACLMSFTTLYSKAQTTIAFQGFEATAEDNWSYTPPVQNPNAPQIIVGAGNYGAGYANTGANSMRFGGGGTACGSGSGNCINGSAGGGSCTNNFNGNTIDFESIDIACYTDVQISVAHRTHALCTGQGQGLDSGDNLNFEISLNGGAFTSQATVVGANNCGWTYASAPGCGGGVANPYQFNVPPGTTTIAFRVRLTHNRSDEVMYIDDVKITGTEQTATASISADGPITFCEGETVTLLTASTGPYQWNLLDEPIEGATQNSYTASESGSYTLTVGSGNCAAVSDPIVVTVTEATEVSIEHIGSTTICEGESVTLQTNDAGPFQWNENDEPIPGATESTYEATEAGSYTLTIGSGTCAGISDPIVVTVNVAPDVVITPNGTIEICEGESITLETTNTGTLQWLFNDEPIPDETSNIISTNQPGDYTLIWSDGTCESISNLITIVQSANLNPLITPSGSIEICDGEVALLEVAGSYDSYQWYNGTNEITGAESNELTITQSGNYSVMVSQGTCEGTSEAVSVNVVVINTPQLTPIAAACVGTTVDLSIPDDYQAYQWLRADDPISGQNNYEYSFVLTESINISVQVEIGNCSVLSNEISITAIPLPIVTINPNEVIVACDETIVITATSSSNTYQWLQSGTPIPGATNSNYTVTQDGDYSIMSTTAGSECSATSEEITVILDSALDVAIEATSLSACEGETITLSVNGSFDTIQWSNNETASTININTSGLYTVEVTSGNCTSYDEVQIVFHPVPIANAGNDTISDCDNGVLLTGAGTGTLTWQAHPTLTPIDGNSIVLVNPTQSTYYVLTSTIGNCVASDSVLVEADCTSIYIPNIFTPNGDGVNDFFEVQVRGASYFHLRIFNRWGEMLFESKDASRVWNGGKKDYYAPDGVYFWTLDVLDMNSAPMLDKNNSHGNLTLLR